ncbi:MAG: hypothetical protein ACXW2E_01510 [Nitrososphaeraceae archaeon]
MNTNTFNPSEISIEIVRLKSVTQALGGSLQIVDEDAPTIGNKEVYKRVTLPLAVARAFIMKHKRVTKYLKPVYTAVVKYGDRIIAMERHPMGLMGSLSMTGEDGKEIVWKPFSQINLDNHIYPYINASNKQWYFDGRYLYSFDSNDMNTNIQKSEPLNADGSYRRLSVESVDLQELSNSSKLDPTHRDCVAFVTETGEFAISPPIWKNILSIGKASKKTKGEFADEEDTSVVITSMDSNILFDRLNTAMGVNLNFALKSGSEIGKLFGYETIEPLKLPQLMIDLHTVNLPNVPKHIKGTYDIGIPFTHAMAWLLGLYKKSDGLESQITIRSLMKYLTKKGIFRSNSFNASQIFKEGIVISDVKLKSLDELLDSEGFSRTSLLNILEQTQSSSRKSVSTNTRKIASGIE